MKVLDLHLLAYGPFTDRHLDLSAGEEGLHVIFGPNEAGKSSALRALRALLYGVPERTQDDFRHDRTQLRVGGRLRGVDGTELHCYRRKGRKNTLLDAADGEPLAKDRLERLLGGVDEALFTRLFGIDYEALVQGGQALLVERGREAEALFGSGLGSPVVHELLQGFEDEAQTLFAPRASKPTINATLLHLADIEKRQREVSLSARQWDEQRKAVNAATRRLEQIGAELSAAEQRHSTLQRFRRTLPGLAKRARFLEQLAALGDVAELEPDFGARREAAMALRRTASQTAIKATARRDQLRREVDAIEIAEAVINEAAAIDALRERLGGYGKAARDKPQLVAQRDSLLAQARGLLAEIGSDMPLDSVDQLRPLLGRRRRVNELGARQGALEAAARQAKAKRQEAADKLAAKQAELDGLTPPYSPGALQQAVSAAQRSGDLDSAIEAARTTLARHQQTCAAALAALSLWTGSIEDLLKAPLPRTETLQRFAQAFHDNAEQARRLQDGMAETELEQQRSDEVLRTLDAAGMVPTETALDEAREHRDNGWRLLRRQWLAGEDVSAQARAYAADMPLADAFEAHVVNADELADRLRREAQRVHDHAAAAARRESCRQRLARLSADLEANHEQRQELERAWQESWIPCDIAPLPPREMQGWMVDAARLREQAKQGIELQAKLDALLASRDRLCSALLEALTAIDAADAAPQLRGELEPLLDHALSRLRSIEDEHRRRGALANAITELDANLRQLERDAHLAEAAFDAWRGEWGTLMDELGQQASASPLEVSDYVDAIDKALKWSDEARALQIRIDGIDAEAREFEHDVRALVIRLAPDLAERPVDQAILQLAQHLADQRAAKSRSDERDNQADQADDELREAEVDIRAADEELAELCRQAACTGVDELQAAEERAREYRELTRQIEEVESELIEGGDGLGLAALEAEVAALDRDSVRAELDELERRIEQELRPEWEAQHAVVLETKREFENMAGGDAASALAEEAQQAVSALRGQAERYTHLKLAARLLRDEIEAFRRTHRDPILTRASTYFAQLTCGSLAAIETDFDDADQPVLVGVRPGGERLRVEAMSTGTRDQLYLALRLATLDHYVTTAGPLPFIVDDILIQFDDQRAEATLAALADFSARTQVILFTHHGRVAEQAAKLKDAAARVFVHELA
ncbi:MAG: AAA family ATPase [Gammaproteobacteria bacterium]